MPTTLRQKCQTLFDNYNNINQDTPTQFLNYIFSTLIPSTGGTITGNLTINGNLALNGTELGINTGVPAAGEPFEFKTNFTNPTLLGNVNNFRGTMNFNATANNASFRMAGVLGITTISNPVSGSAGNLGYAIGVQGTASSNVSTGTVANIVAVYGSATKGGAATATNMFAHLAELILSGGVATNIYGLQVKTPAISGGAVPTNVYGVNIEDMSSVGATQVFGLRVLGTTVKSFIAGRLGIRENVPTANLHIGAGSTTQAQMNLALSPAPTGADLHDGDIWREDNTNTGLKIRVNGVTKTITLA